MPEPYLNRLIAIRELLDNPSSTQVQFGLELLSGLVQEHGQEKEFLKELDEIIRDFPKLSAEIETLKPQVVRGDRARLKSSSRRMVSKKSNPHVPKIFISYSHKDEKFKDELITILIPLQNQGILEIWQDRRIEEGDEWYQAIQDAMNTCNLALLLVSKNFLASRFITAEELPRLLEQRKKAGLRVVPIIISACMWQSVAVLKDLQALPRDGKPVVSFKEETGDRDEVWTEIAKTIEARASSLTKETVVHTTVEKDSSKANERKAAAKKVSKTERIDSKPVAEKNNIKVAELVPKNLPTVEEKRKQRLSYLRYLYERSGGDPLSYFPFVDIGQELGFDDVTTDKITDYLRDEGLVNFPTFGTVSITHEGIQYVENILSKLGKPNPKTTRKSKAVSILFLSADPTDYSRLRIGEEMREIQEKLQLSKQRSRFKLNLRTSARPEDISQAMLDLEPNIVHFSGHGLETGALCFENQSGKMQAVTPAALAALFDQFDDSVDCVLLNACYSEKQAQAISEHIEWVIGMNDAIGDQAALSFSIGFYQALGAGKNIEEAYKLGCVQIRLQGIPEHLTPVLIKKE